jgi:hypothetical protein
VRGQTSREESSSARNKKILRSLNSLKMTQRVFAHLLIMVQIEFWNIKISLRKTIH